MKVYIDENREVYTENNIDDKIREILENFDYEGVVDYLLSKYTEGDILNMLNPNAQEEVFDHLKMDILQENFYEQEIDV
nr:MAG TPA: hypothetical protein [Caudoviricetes sp.]